MTLQLLRYYVAIAQSRNFTRAAKECYISQPALSKAIRQLEAELGCPLLIRTTRTVELTEAGRACLKEARHILRQCDQLRERVLRAQSNTAGVVRVGYMMSSQIRHLYRTVNRLKVRFSLDEEYGTMNAILGRLQSGQLDVVLVPCWAVSGISSIASVSLIPSRLLALLPRSHPLAACEEIPIEALKDERFIGWDTEEVAGANEMHRAFCREHGFFPRYVDTARKVADAEARVLLNDAVSLIGQTVADMISNQCVARPIAGTQPVYGTVMAWMRENPSPALAKLVGLMGGQLQAIDNTAL